MVKISLKYSVICGIFLIGMYHLSFLLDSNPLIDVTHLIFDIIIFGLFIFFAEKEFKTYKNGGILHFWQGMSIGFLVYGLATFIFIISLVIYFVADIDAVINYKEAATKFLNERAEIYKDQFGKESYEKQLEDIRSVTKWDLIFSSSIKKIMAGFFITPVISIILRKQNKPNI